MNGDRHLCVFLRLPPDACSTGALQDVIYAEATQDGGLVRFVRREILDNGASLMRQLGAARARAMEVWVAHEAQFPLHT